MTKNLCGKTRKADNPYEVWENARAGWQWLVLKKWQSPEKEKENEYARWFCLVKTPIVPSGEMGDVYVKEIKENAVRIK